MGRTVMFVACLSLAMLAAGQTARAQGSTDPGPSPAGARATPVDEPAPPPQVTLPGDATLSKEATPPDDEARPNDADTKSNEARANSARLPDKAATAKDSIPLSRVFVSVESSLPWLTGNSLRKAIRRQTGFEVVSLSERKIGQDDAAALNAPLLIVTVSRRGEVTLVCRSAPRGIDWIRVRPPMKSLLDATATLAAAVLRATRDYQARRAERESQAIERVVLAPPAESAPDWATGLPGNPYYGPLDRGPERPYISPYNPYYLKRLPPPSSPRPYSERL